MILLVPPASALELVLRAEVDPDLRHVRGTLRADEPVELVDPLAALPEPPDDRTLFRTFPGAKDAGEMTWSPTGDGGWAFEARLPRRYGAVGALPRGLFGDGGWYPQPVGPGGEARIATWDVDVRLPKGATGVLNGVVGAGEIRWTGVADRAAMAVVEHAHVTTIAVRGGEVRFVEHGRPERPVARWLTEAVEEAWPLEAPPDLTVVEDLDLLRLARSAPDTVFLPDRAFRLSPGFLRPYHLDAVRREVAAAALQGHVPAFADAQARDFGAAALTAALPTRSVRKLLGWFSWNPVVDALLYDGTMPYFADIFDEPFGGPPGLFEVLGGRIPGRAAAAQLDDLRGKGSALAVTRAAMAGTPLSEAALALGVPATLVDGWSRPYRGAQDYVVRVDADGARVERKAPSDAPPEVMSVVLDGEMRSTWLTGTGPDTLPLPASSRPRSVRLDGKVQEEDLANDRWPANWTVVLNGGFYNLTPSQHAFDLAADLLFRRRNDSRNLFVASVEHDAQDLFSFDVGFVRYLGPLVDRRTRTHRLYVSAGPSLLDPSFRPTDRGSVAIGGAASYAWDTRTDDFFALSGHRYAVGVGGGFVPESTDRWASASVSAVQLLSPHPRHVFALRAKAGWASGDVEHRLLPLGGGGDVRAIPEPEVVGNERLDATLEYRWAPLRNASIPLPLLWLSDIHVSPAIDAGVAWRGPDRYAAVGASLGVHVITDLLGAQPNLFGATLAIPVWTDGFEATDPQLYIDFTHAF